MDDSSKISVSQASGVTVVALKSASLLDAVEIDTIGRQIDAALADLTAPKVILDLRNLQNLSSSMIGVFLTVHKKAQATKGRVVLCGLKPHLMKVFQIANLDRILSFAADGHEALKRLQD
ncbi:MAG: STAS domain-containing protein [Planctomycetaceae bacterium]|nr:STAS domain-containing protein [Planctomycetaceae bacterium]